MDSTFWPHLFFIAIVGLSQSKSVLPEVTNSQQRWQALREGNLFGPKDSHESKEAHSAIGSRAKHANTRGLTALELERAYFTHSEFILPRSTIIPRDQSYDWHQFYVVLLSIGVGCLGLMWLIVMVWRLDKNVEIKVEKPRFSTPDSGSLDVPGSQTESLSSENVSCGDPALEVSSCGSNQPEAEVDPCGCDATSDEVPQARNQEVVWKGPVEQTEKSIPVKEPANSSVQLEDAMNLGIGAGSKSSPVLGCSSKPCVGLERPADLPPKLPVLSTPSSGKESVGENSLEQMIAFDTVCQDFPSKKTLGKLETASGSELTISEESLMLQHRCNQLLTEQMQQQRKHYEQHHRWQAQLNHIQAQTMLKMLSYFRRLERRKDIKERWSHSMDSLQWGIWMLNISFFVCYCAFGRWQNIRSGCTALFNWYNMESYLISATCILKEAVALVLVMPITMYTTRCLTTMPLLKRGNPLATPFLIAVFGGVGLLETLPLICAGGSVAIFWGLWTTYSAVSILSAKSRLGLSTVNLASSESVRPRFQADSAWVSLALGLVFPVLNGCLPFIHMGLSDFLLIQLFKQAYLL